MNAKEAREILKIHKHQKLAIQNDLKFNPTHEARYLFIEAKSYLACLEGPEVKALKHGISEFFDILDDGPDDSDVAHAVRKLKEALAQYRESLGRKEMA